MTCNKCLFPAELVELASWLMLPFFTSSVLPSERQAKTASGSRQGWPVIGEWGEQKEKGTWWN